MGFFAAMVIAKLSSVALLKVKYGRPFVRDIYQRGGPPGAEWWEFQFRLDRVVYEAEHGPVSADEWHKIERRFRLEFLFFITGSSLATGISFWQVALLGCNN
jgi:hypothetical protein